MRRHEIIEESYIHKSVFHLIIIIIIVRSFIAHFMTEGHLKALYNIQCTFT